MTTRIEIANAALARIGAEPLQSEDAPGADQVLRLYDDTVRTLLAMKRWRFATRTMQLGRLATTPAGSFWTCAFQLPGDRLGLPDAVFDRPAAESVAGGRPFTAYEIFEDAIHTEAERLWVRYRWLAPIAIWPALFRECVTLALASDCAAAINEDDRRRDDLRREVYGDPRMPGSLGLLGKASSMDAQSSPSRIAGVEVGALLDVRRAGA